MEPNGNTRSDRNDALDIFRAVALMMMISIHFIRGFTGNYPGTWESVARFILESAPVFFFIAFGMTASRTISGDKRWRRLLELGVVSLLHQGYLMEISPFKFDFLFFLWFVFLVFTIFRPLFMVGFVRLLFLLIILGFNLLIGHDKIGLWGAHPFAPIPWASLVILGMLVGLKTQNEKERVKLILYGIACIAVSLLVKHYAYVFDLDNHLARFSKWHPTTSTYLLFWSGIALCLYGIIGWIKLRSNSYSTKFIRILSLYLLQGTVFHYFTNSWSIKIFNQAGFSADNTFTWYALVVSIIFICAAIYFVIMIAIDVRKLLVNYIISDRNLYIIGWIISIVIFMIALILSFGSFPSTLLWVISALGMLFASFTFMDTTKVEKATELRWEK